MSFRDHTMVTTDEQVLLHQFFGPRRNGPMGFVTPVEVDTPHTDPLDGAGSLEMRIFEAVKAGYQYRTSVSKRGLKTGTLTCQLHCLTQPASGQYAFGLYCYASSVNMLTAGDVYLLGCVSFFSGPNNPFGIFLLKSNTGILGYDDYGNLLAVSANNAWSLNTFFTLRLSWERQTNGHLLLTASSGLLPDLSDMTELFQVDEASPLTTTVAEGLWVASRTSTAVKVFADEAEWFRGIK